MWMPASVSASVEAVARARRGLGIAFSSTLHFLYNLSQSLIPAMPVHTRRDAAQLRIERHYDVPISSLQCDT